MNIKTILGTATALALTATPIAASAAPAATSLSVAKSARTGGTTSNASDLGGGGGGLAALLIGAGVIAIGVIAIVNGSDDNDRSDSN